MPKRLNSLCLCATLAGALLALPAMAQGKKTAPPVDLSKLPPVSEKKDVTYATDIKPILDQSCAKCHGAERPKARLRLDSHEGALKGGENGKVITPGDSTKSILVISAAHLGDPDLFMPPPNNKGKIPPLTKEQVGLIRAWVDQGAK